MLRVFILSEIKDMKGGLYMINENTEVLIIGWPDPLDDNYIDYFHRCVLKDSLSKMKDHIKELNFDRKRRMFYQFSVLLIGEKSGHKLIYTYYRDKTISVKDEFKDIMNELGIRSISKRYRFTEYEEE